MTDPLRTAGGVSPQLQEAIDAGKFEMPTEAREEFDRGLESCERCGGTKVDPAGATPGASCTLCCDEDWPFDEDPPDPL